MSDTHKAPGESPGDGTARHGGRTEVNWEDGRGRQPYDNQDADAAGPPNGADEFAGGDRGELSGRNIEQLEQAKKKP